MTSSARPTSPRSAPAEWALAPQADHDELFRFQTFLLAYRDSPLRIDAAALRRPDTLVLQMLVAACRDWTARSLSFQVADMPERVVGVLPLLGLRPDMIGIEAC